MPIGGVQQCEDYLGRQGELEGTVYNVHLFLRIGLLH
jgi:hypothetical protein